MELLKLIYPGPIGKGMKIKDAAKKLKISRRAATYRLFNIKKKFPKFWEQYLAACRVMRRERISLTKIIIDDDIAKNTKFLEFF